MTGSTSTPRPPSPDGLRIISFKSSKSFETWLHKNHSAHPGFWMRIYKKASKKPSIDYAQALDVALCYGWIDGQKRPGDTISWLQRFTRRNKKSAWSKVNTGHVERLIREGRVQPAGMAVIEAAKADGRWDAAYGSSSTFEMPLDFLAAISLNAKAMTQYELLPKGSRYLIYYRLTSAKRAETRERRLQDFVRLLASGQRPT